MTIQDVFNKYKGQSLLVPGADPSDIGQCVQAADYFLHEVYGLPYIWLNAIDWWRNPDANLKANFDFIPYSPNMPIKKGDFVIYGSGVGSPYGHISTAIQDGVGSNYLGADSNWGHNLTLHQVNHNDSYNQYILGVLRRKGDNVPMATDSLTKEEIAGIYQLAFDNDDYPPNLIKAYTGKPLDGLVTQLLRDPSYKAHKAKVNAPPVGMKPYSGPQLYVQE